MKIVGVTGFRGL